MKSILYVGAALMVGASIYGFVDYRQTHNKKEFRQMYSATPAETDVIAETTDAKVTGTTTVEKQAVNSVSNTEGKKNTAKNTVAKKKAAVKKKKAKRTFNTGLFSRGALEERYIKPIEKEEVKTDTKKTEEKEQ